MNRYTENQVLGYLIISLEDLGKNEEEIKKIINQMNQNMEVWTEEHAEQTYDEF